MRKVYISLGESGRERRGKARKRKIGKMTGSWGRMWGRRRIELKSLRDFNFFRVLTKLARIWARLGTVGGGFSGWLNYRTGLSKGEKVRKRLPRMYWLTDNERIAKMQYRKIRELEVYACEDSGSNHLGIAYRWEFRWIGKNRASNCSN